MGIIFSKPRDYVARKVDECNNAIRKKVDDTKASIVNRINSTVQSVKLCLVTTKDDIVGSIVGVKDNICGRITQKVNCVCEACIRVRNNVVGKVTYAKNSVINTKNSIVDTVVSTKNGIFNRYHNTKTYIKDTFTNSKNYLKKNYNAKLTKWQKLKYSLISLVIMLMMYIVIATSFDVYIGDFASVEERFCIIRDNVCTISYHTYTISCTIIVNTYFGLRCTIVFLWKYFNVIIKQTYIYMVEVKKCCYESSKEAIHHMFHLINLTFETAIFYFIEMCSYIWKATCYFADETSQLILFISKHVSYYSKIAWENVKIGSKIAYQHSKVVLSYSYKHGSVFLKDFIQKGSHFLYYLITDFKHASVDGLIWLWAASKQLLLSGIEASYRFYQYFGIALAFLHQSLLSLSFWSYETSFKLSNYFYSACSYTYSKSLDLSSQAYEGIIYARNNTYEAMILSNIYLYDKACHFVFFLFNFVFGIYQYLINASIYEKLSYFMNEYGFEWLHRLKEIILHTTNILFSALSKFFSDLCHLLYKFVTVTSERIYNITYFLFFIVFKILHISSGTFKYVLSSLVVLMKIFFASIVGFMKFAIIAYSSILSSYNQYRESIFFSLMTLISIYCVSIAKDRKISEQKYLLEMEMSDNDDDDDVDEVNEDVEKSNKGDDNNVTNFDVDFDSSFSHDEDAVENKDKGDVSHNDKKCDIIVESVLDIPSKSTNSNVDNV